MIIDGDQPVNKILDRASEPLPAKPSGDVVVGS